MRSVRDVYREITARSIRQYKKKILTYAYYLIICEIIISHILCSDAVLCVQE